MKKITALGMTIVVTSLLFVGCSNNDKKNVAINDKKTELQYNPFDLNDEQSIINAEFGFGPVNPVDELIYNGKPIEIEYFYDNTGDTDFNSGFMIFIDGIAQSYKIDGENKEEIMHEFNLKKKSKIKFKASFTPSIGKKGDKLGLYVTATLNPKIIPDKNYPDFGNNQGMSQVLPVNLKYLKSVNNKEKKIYDKYSTKNITENIKKEYLGEGKNRDEEYNSNMEPLLRLKYKDDYKESKIELKRNSKLNLELEGFCGPSASGRKYRTTIFIDNKPVKTIDGKEYLEMNLNKEMLSKQAFDVDISGIKGSHVLYTISVPVGNDYKTNLILKSDAKLLVVEE